MLAAGGVGAAALPALAVAGIGWRATLGVAAPAFLVAAVAVWWAVPDTRGDAEGTDDGIATAVRSAAVAVRDRRIALAVAGATLMLFVFQVAIAFLTTYLVDVKGLTQGTAGVLLGVVFVVGAVARWTCGGPADRFGTPRVLTAVSVVPLVALPQVGSTPALIALSALIGVRLSVGPVSNASIIGLLPDTV